MKGIKMQAEELRSKAIALRYKTEDIYSARGISTHPDTMLKLLAAIEEDLSKETISRKRLEGHALGIFRIITDGWILEDSEVGSELMSFRLDLRKFASILQEGG